MVLLTARAGFSTSTRRRAAGWCFVLRHPPVASLISTIEGDGEKRTHDAIRGAASESVQARRLADKSLFGDVLSFATFPGVDRVSAACGFHSFIPDGAIT